jgi:DNA-binding transcriptional ArsR family regulator
VSATAEAVADEVFGALADGTRRRVLTLLAEHGDGTATTVAAELPVSRPAVVKHLGILERAGLVDARKRGREVRYTVRPQPLHETATWLGAIAHEWDERLSRLKRLAEGGP